MGALLLFITTFIWGTAFLAQKLGSDSLGPFAITVFRNLLGGAFLSGCILVRNRTRGGDQAQFGGSFSRSLLAGVWCGIALFAAMIAQQVGIQYTTPGISAFLTTNYVIFVPLIGALLSRKMPSLGFMILAVMALGGTYLICLPGGDRGLRFGIGEALTILCAVLFAVQMLVVDHFARRCDVLVMSMSQLFTGCVVGLPFIFTGSELAKLSSVMTWQAIWPLLYLGILSSGIAYTLQNIGQAKTPPALAAIVLSMESVFGALSGWIVLGDRLECLQLIGCAIVLISIVLTQIVPKSK